MLDSSHHSFKPLSQISVAFEVCFYAKGNSMRQLLLPVLLIAGITVTSAQTSADSADIRQTALDYVEGWYAGDVDRMERALHPELQKRIVQTDESGKSFLGNMGVSNLLRNTRRGGGKNTPKEQQQKDVIILDIYQNVASVKTVATHFIDYLHIAKWDGEWKIVNVLWELKPKEGM